MKWRRRELSVFFPWERKSGLVSRLAKARVSGVVLLILTLLAARAIYLREDHSAAVRATRAAIANGYRAVGAFRADHQGACPASLTDLVKGNYIRAVPRDAWGRPLRLVCPGRRDTKGFELVSDGPDGEPFGIDRVE